MDSIVTTPPVPFPAGKTEYAAGVITRKNLNMAHIFLCGNMDSNIKPINEPAERGFKVPIAGGFPFQLTILSQLGKTAVCAAIEGKTTEVLTFDDPTKAITCVVDVFMGWIEDNAPKADPPND